jgi:hypothetical protein
MEINTTTTQEINLPSLGAINVADATAGETQVLAAVVPTNVYTELCTTLNCAPGEAASVLLAEVARNTNARYRSYIHDRINAIETAGNMYLLYQEFLPSGSLNHLTQ